MTLPPPQFDDSQLKERGNKFEIEDCLFCCKRAQYKGGHHLQDCLFYWYQLLNSLRRFFNSFTNKFLLVHMFVSTYVTRILQIRVCIRVGYVSEIDTSPIRPWYVSDTPAVISAYILTQPIRSPILRWKSGICIDTAGHVRIRSDQIQKLRPHASRARERRRGPLPRHEPHCEPLPHQWTTPWTSPALWTPPLRVNHAVDQWKWTFFFLLLVRFELGKSKLEAKPLTPHYSITYVIS